MRAHETLAIDLIQLRNISDQAVQMAYQKKLKELEVIDVIEVQEYERRKKELEVALAAIQTQQKRDAYLQAIAQPHLVVNSVGTDTANISTSSTSTWKDINERVRTYQKYIDRKIQNLDRFQPDYQEIKAKLETSKKRQIQ